MSEVKNAPEKTEEEQRDEELAKNAMEEIRARYTHGKLKLLKPIKDGSDVYESLIYDFSNLTGNEYAQAMDSDRGNTQNNVISKEQALALFAISAGKENASDTKRLDKYDVLSRIGAQDAIAAARIATSFFYMSFNSADSRIEKL